MTTVGEKAPARRSRRPVALLVAALIALGGLAGAGGVAVGTVAVVSGHGEGHSTVDGDVMDPPHVHRHPAGLP